ncbi:MAG: cytochrome c3 family protein [Planctomycetota bacterium]
MSRHRHADGLAARAHHRDAARSRPRCHRALGARCLALAGLLTVLWTAACTATGRYEVLRFFFDGVPPPAGAAAEVLGPEPPPGIGPADAPADAASGAAAPAVPSLEIVEHRTIHRPYAEGKCAKCHASREGKPAEISSIFQGVPMLLEPVEKLCFKCHQIEPKRYLHAPAISGQCIFCHEPHQTANRRMLLFASTRALCGRCHSGATFLTAAAHEQYGERECVDCHDPHSADLEFNLLPGAREGQPAARAPTVSLPREW